MGVQVICRQPSNSTFAAFQQLNDLGGSNVKNRNAPLAYSVACLNAFLWTVFVFIAFLQVNKHTYMHP